jgi:hypothetical protein
MDYATKEDRDWTEWWIYMALWIHTGMEIWIIGDLQSDMCLICLEEHKLDEQKTATHASKEAVWLQRLCSGIGLVQQDVRIECDS